MTNLFQKLEIEAFRAGVSPRTKESRDWFRKKINNLRGTELRRINRNTLMKDPSLSLSEQQVIGSMYMFFYDPKHKKTLPYYDSFPLVIVLDRAEGGFLGLNLHYLPPVLRAKFLDSLMETTTNNKFDETTKFKITYERLKAASNLKYFKPCIKHYLTDHVRSRFAKVDSPEWEIATFLPTASWQKSTGAKVYSASRKKLNA
jgi:hypothetical protein